MSRFNINSKEEFLIYCKTWNANGKSEMAGLGDAFGEEYFYKNNYNTNKWNKMQLVGAVFLPACGYRNGTEIGNIDITGVYWTTTCNEQNNPQYLYFCSNYLSLTHGYNPYYGQAVRLVCK